MGLFSKPILTKKRKKALDSFLVNAVKTLKELKKEAKSGIVKEMYELMLGNVARTPIYFYPSRVLCIVEIPDIDVEACGGTHVPKTGDAGFFKIIKREGVQDGVERIRFVCGLKALKHIQEKEKLLEEAAGKLAV